ncbi:MAG: hypothetical protein R3B47_18025 [Bacteroidia bacterium]
MNRLLPFFAALVLILGSCKKGKEQAPVPPEIAPWLEGFWMADEYLNSIEEKRSVFASEASRQIFLGFFLEEKKIANGTFTLNGLSDRKEGFTAEAVWKNADQRFHCRLNEAPRDSFSLWLTRTGMVKCFFEDNDVKEFYRREKTVQDALRKALLGETYRNIPGETDASIDKRGLARFADNPHITRFEVDHDFSDGQHVDLLMFFSGDEDAPSYFLNYVFSNDTLFLYEMNSLEPGWEVGAQKCKLLPEEKRTEASPPRQPEADSDFATLPVHFYPPGGGERIDTVFRLKDLKHDLTGFAGFAWPKMAHNSNSDTEIHFYNDSLRIEIKVAEFDESRHLLEPERGPFIKHIDGTTFWGTDGSLPRLEIEQIRVFLQEKEIALSDSLWFNVYEPNLHPRACQATAIPEGGFALHMFNGDGAGAYTVIWLFASDGSLKARMVDHNF